MALESVPSTYQLLFWLLLQQYLLLMAHSQESSIRPPPDFLLRQRSKQIPQSSQQLYPLHEVKNSTPTTETKRNIGSPSSNLKNGLNEIYNKLNLFEGYSNFLQAFTQLQFDEGVQEKESKNSNLHQDIHEESENLNKTPYFGSEGENKLKHHEQEGSIAKILGKIRQKNSQSLLEFSANFNNLYKTQPTLLQAIFQKVRDKMDEASAQFSANYALLEQKIAQKQAEYPSTSKQVDEDNQFMSEEFEVHQRLEEAHNYVAHLKNESMEGYVKSTQNEKQSGMKFSLKVKTILQNYERQQYSHFFAQLKNPTSHFRSEFREKNELDRAFSQKMSSAQSQRLKSAQKYSENQQSFNLDLTAKSKNFKNPYLISKGDSLIYSAQSGFFPPESPNRIQQSNSSKSVKQKMDDIKEDNLQNQSIKSNLYKSHSQRVEYDKMQNNRRIISSKQKIQQNHQNQYLGNQSIQKLSQYRNDIKIQDLDRFQAVQNQKSLHQQFLHSHQNQQANFFSKRSSQNLQEKVDAKAAKNSKGTLLKLKNQNAEEQKSAKAQTIINGVENFDADDEDDEQEKQLHQSAHLSQKEMNEKIIRKRVETEQNRNKKGIKHQNYSIKNIKRFNKIDFTQHQQQNKRSTSQVVSYENSNSNIFSTQIDSYQKKISKLREEKEIKKKNLERQLAKINQELKMLNQKQEQLSPQNKNNFASRVKISDNNEAQRKAQSLVKNLRSQKRNRNIAKVGQFVNLDKNINDYMQELNKLRAENEEKLKQKKKLQILERMKQNQMRKLNEKKKITENQNFVLHLKGANGINAEVVTKNEPDKYEKLSKRSPTKQEQQIISSPQLSNLTPQLNQKKAQLNKVRNFSVKKQHRDAYEQILS